MTLASDVRYALRSMRRTPVFTAAAMLTLALGIGANTAIFSVVNAVLLRPLPFASPERLIRIYEKNDKLNLPTFSSSVLNYLSWKEQAQSFDEMGFFGFGSFNLSGSGEPEQFAGGPLSPSLLRLLGIQPVEGRFFRDDEEKPGSAPVALISEGLWRRHFGSNPGLLGSTVILNQISYTVVGIAPASLNFLTGGDVWIPYTIDLTHEARLQHTTLAVARLKRDVSMQQAQAEMDTIARRVGMQYPEVKDWGVRLQTFERWIVGEQLRQALMVLLAAVAAVLLIACANVANLLLSRSAARRKEIATRAALGAGRGRLVRQFLTESILLSTFGGGVGVLAALWTIRLMSGSLPRNLLPVSEITIDSNVLLFALAAAVITGILFGLAPAWQNSNADLNNVLKQGGRSSASGARPILRKILIAGELAIATVLLIGAGLLMQTLSRLGEVRVGFRPEQLLTFQVSPISEKYATPEKLWQFYDALLQSVRSIPGVRDAASSSGIPFGAGYYNTTPAQPIGSPIFPATEALPIDWRIVSPGYFRAMEIPLLRGRDFTAQDRPTSPQVVIVSQRTAERFWGKTDPVGHVLRVTGSGREFTVIGVAGDGLNASLGQAIQPAMYFSASARASSLMEFVVRTEGDPLQAATAARRKLGDLDPDLPMSNVRTMEQWISGNSARPRLNSVLLEVFSGIALVIAAIGIYGVLSYSVNQQVREIGVRVALGARRSEVLRLVVQEGMTMALAGIAVGLAAAFGVSRVLATLLFGVQPRDPLTFGAVAAILTLVAMAACVLPAWKASRIDPVIALRCE